MGGGLRGEAGVGGGALLRRRAASQRRPAPALSRRGGSLHLRPPASPSQKDKAALDYAEVIDSPKSTPEKRAEVIKLLKNAPAVKAQVGRTAPLLPVRTPRYLCALPKSPSL